MNEQEEFEFRRRRELELGQTPPPPAGMVHQQSAGQTMPRQASQWGDVLEGGLSALDLMKQGAIQRLSEVLLPSTPPPAQVQKMYDAAGLKADPAAYQQQEIDRRAAEEKETLLKGPKSWAHGAGDIAARTTVGAAATAPLGMSWPAAAAGGALIGALEPTVSALERNKNMAMGAASTTAMTAGARAAMPRVSIEPERQLLAEGADRVGMKYTGGQLTGLPYVQLAESHSLWNPLTRTSATRLARGQEDDFVRAQLRRLGLDDDKIPKNPSLSPEQLQRADDLIKADLDYNFAGKQYDPTAFTTKRTFPDPITGKPTNLSVMDAAQVAKYFSSGNKQVQKLVRDIADEVLTQGSAALAAPPKTVKNFRYDGVRIQEVMRDVKEAIDKSYSGGDKRAAETLERIHEAMVASLKNPDLYRESVRNYAHLKMMEEHLRQSSKMGMGVPNPSTFGFTLERNLPGAVIRNRSPMADVARAGELTKGPAALPERASGIPRFPSDFANAATYWRFNNPAAIWGFRNPAKRDMLEQAARYLPQSVGNSSVGDATSDELRRLARLLTFRNGEQ